MFNKIYKKYMKTAHLVEIMWPARNFWRVKIRYNRGQQPPSPKFKNTRLDKYKASYKYWQQR